MYIIKLKEFLAYAFFLWKRR